MIADQMSLKIWIKDFVSIFLKPVKEFRQITFGENITELGRICQNVLYWRLKIINQNPVSKFLYTLFCSDFVLALENNFDGLMEMLYFLTRFHS